MPNDPQAKSCEFRIEGDGLLSIKLFDDRKFLIDLKENGLGSETGTNMTWQRLMKMMDSHNYDCLVIAGFRLRLDNGNRT